MERKLKTRNLFLIFMLFVSMAYYSTGQGSDCLISGENILPLGTSAEFCVSGVPANATNKEWMTYGDLAIVNSNSNCITVTSTGCGTSLLDFSYCAPEDIFTTGGKSQGSDAPADCCNRCIFEINTPVADCCVSTSCCVPIVEGGHQCKPNGNCGDFCPPPGPSGNECGDGFFAIAFPNGCTPTNIESIDIVMSSGSVFQSGPFAGLSNASNITPGQIWWNLGSGTIPICSDACYGQTIDVEVTIRYTSGCEDVEVVGHIEGGCLCGEQLNNEDQGGINLKLSPNPMNGSQLRIDADGHFHNNMELQIVDFNTSEIIYYQSYKNENIDNLAREYSVPVKYSNSKLVVQILINGEVKESQILMPSR